jgi:hypothetical protein
MLMHLASSRNRPLDAATGIPAPRQIAGRASPAVSAPSELGVANEPQRLKVASDLVGSTSMDENGPQG